MYPLSMKTSSDGYNGRYGLIHSTIKEKQMAPYLPDYPKPKKKGDSKMKENTFRLVIVLSMVGLFLFGSIWSALNESRLNKYDKWWTDINDQMQLVIEAQGMSNDTIWSITNKSLPAIYDEFERVDKSLTSLKSVEISLKRSLEKMVTREVVEEHMLKLNLTIEDIDQQILAMNNKIYETISVAEQLKAKEQALRQVLVNFKTALKALDGLDLENVESVVETKEETKKEFLEKQKTSEEMVDVLINDVKTMEALSETSSQRDRVDWYVDVDVRKKIRPEYILIYPRFHRIYDYRE